MRISSTLMSIVVVPLLMLSLAILQALSTSGDTLQAEELPAPEATPTAYVGSAALVPMSASVH